MRRLNLFFLISALLALGVFAGCRPTDVPVRGQPSSLPSPIAPQQVAPAATRELPPGPLAAPTVSPAPSAAASGIRLTALIGPTCPGPERPDQVCTQPYVGPFVVKAQDGKPIASITTDEAGKVTLDLPPGQYTVTPKTTGRWPQGASVAVTVLPGQYVDVNAELDTGMR